MTQDEIIEMATQVYGECVWHKSALLRLKAFAKLVAAKAIAELESQEPVAQPASEEDMKIYRAIADNYRKELTHPPQRTEQEPLANELAQLKEEIALLKYKLWDCEEKSKPMQGQ
jgi:RecB family exonuclease